VASLGTPSPPMVGRAATPTVGSTRQQRSRASQAAQLNRRCSNSTAASEQDVQPPSRDTRPQQSHPRSRTPNQDDSTEIATALRRSHKKKPNDAEANSCNSLAPTLCVCSPCAIFSDYVQIAYFVHLLSLSAARTL